MYLKHRETGVTLLELMIVVAIIGIIAAVAYPSYQQHVVKSWRTTATGCLMELAQGMERHFTANMTYVGAPAVAAASCALEGSMPQRYTFTTPATAALPVNPAAAAFLIVATPVGSQGDSDRVNCMSLSLNQAGVRSVSGTATVNECW